MTGAYELLLNAQRRNPDLIASVEEVPDAWTECQYCGYAEFACCCDFLCFWREQPCCPPCLEPKDNPADDSCKFHADDVIRDRALDIFGSVK